MMATEDGITIELNDEHSLNIPFPTAVMLPGMLTFASPVHFLNTSSPTAVNELGKTNCVKPEQ